MEQWIEHAVKAVNSAELVREGDHWEGDVLYCGQCGTPKYEPVAFCGKLVPRRVRCRCEEQQDQLERQKRQREEFLQELHRRRATDRISDGSFVRSVFAADDQADDATSQVCRRYVERWPQMRENNMGILFFGSVGAGKTFLAGCIVNALEEQLVTGTVTSFPRLLNLLQDSHDRQGILDALNRYDVLVIDDLGTERDSPYALEQVYNIIDSRGKSGKPLIVTTNLTLQQLKNPEDLKYARIYDRILELCPITLKMTGESRRAVNAKAKRELARQLLA